LLFAPRKKDSQWIGFTDIMSAVMMVFLFIAVAFMLKVEAEKEILEKRKLDAEEKTKELQAIQSKVKTIAMTYQKSQLDLNSDLHREFDKDLHRWNAEITDDNRIRFKAPDILFTAGSSELSERFKEILNELFPRYVRILKSPKYVNEIDEIKIEGHTSYGWGNTRNLDYIYRKNLELSQKRASTVVDYCLDLYSTKSDKWWLIDRFRANGMAFAKPIFKYTNGKKRMNYELSRRVEIVVTTKSAEKIFKIIEELK